MRNLKLFFVVAVMLLAACGSDAASEATSDAEDSTATAASPAQDSGPDASADGNGSSVSGPANDDAGETDDSDSSGGSVSVSSLDDIPQVCRDLMSDFLKDIEPIVSPIDWDNATLADFEAISTEFEARADQFDTDSDASPECDDIDLEDDESFDLLIEFAEDEAPGTVGFMTFLSGFLDAASSSTGAGTGEAAGGGFETCDEAIAFMDELMANYDSMAEVPVTELTAMTDIVTVIFSCTPEQMTYFDSPEVDSFFGEFFE